MEDPKAIYQGQPSSLASRRFEQPSAAIRVSNQAKKAIKLGASFASGRDSPHSMMIMARIHSKRLSGAYCRHMLQSGMGVPA